MRIQYVRTNEKELHIQNSLMSFFRKQTKPNSRFLYVHDFLFFLMHSKGFFFLCFMSTSADYHLFKSQNLHTLKALS